MRIAFLILFLIPSAMLADLSSAVATARATVGPDTSRIVKWLDTDIQTGTTPPNIVTVQRDQWDAQKRQVLKTVAQSAGIVKADLQNAETIKTKIETWIGGLSNANREAAEATLLPVFWIAYNELRDDFDSNAASYDVDTGSRPITVKRWSQLGLARMPTGAEIEAVQR